MSQEKPKKHRWLLWAAIVSVFVFLISPFMMYRLRNRAEFNRKVRELAAAGFPVSDNDLQALHVLMEGVENAADIYENAFVAYVDPNEAERQLLPIRGDYETNENEPPFPQEVLDMIRIVTARNRQCLESLDEAAKIEHCLFSVEFKGFLTLLPYLSELKRSAQIISERNILLAQTGQTDALIDSTQTGIMLSKRISPCPFLIENLVIGSTQSIAADSLENSLNLIRFSEEQLSILQRQFHEMQKTETYIPSLVAERATWIEVANMPPSEFSGCLNYGGSSSLPEKGISILYYLSGLKDKDAIFLLDVYKKWIESAQLPCHKQPIELDKLQKEINAYCSSWYSYGLAEFVPSLRVGKMNLRIKGYLQCAETALAIERHRLKNQSLPESLDVLVPEFIDTVFLDPFDGKPLRYQLRDDGGYTVYHIGEDGIDNGGLDREQMTQKMGTSSRAKEYDWPFTIKR